LRYTVRNTDDNDASGYSPLLNAMDSFVDKIRLKNPFTKDKAMRDSMAVKSGETCFW